MGKKKDTPAEFSIVIKDNNSFRSRLSNALTVLGFKFEVFTETDTVKPEITVARFSFQTDDQKETDLIFAITERLINLENKE